MIKIELTFEEKLRRLYDLQFIDTELDKIRNTRGELPLEVEDLKNDILQIQNKKTKLKNDILNLNQEIKIKKDNINYAKLLINKYKKQLDKIKNHREHTVLNKEIEYQNLEIELSEKRIKEFNIKIHKIQDLINKIEETLQQHQNHLIHKKNELDDLVKETEKEEDFLMKKSEEFASFIDKNLLSSYKKIRNNSKNGLAVVSIERGAAIGSYFTIPPQKIVEISLRKKIITDEHSGKILVDTVLAEEENKKMKKLLNK